MSTKILFGDAREKLQEIPSHSVHLCVTSPPYWGLRDYCDDPREIGAEPTPDAYIANLVDVFREVRRVLRDDGVLVLNLGDTFSQTGGVRTYGSSDNQTGRGPSTAQRQFHAKPKDKLLIPYRVALALQADGWYVRSDMPWLKSNAMPESVKDRPTVSHEYVFLLTKSEDYYWDAWATRVLNGTPHASGNGFKREARLSYQNSDGSARGSDESWEPAADGGRNYRTADMWFGSLDIMIEETEQRLAELKHLREHSGMVVDEDGDPLALPVSLVPYKGPHHAVYPPKLIEPLIQAGCPHTCCPHCGKGWIRVVERYGMPSKDSKRPQARRAAELWEESGLTEEHLVAIRAVGLADAGKARVQMGNKNSEETLKLAKEAKEKLGGYFREFLMPTNAVEDQKQQERANGARTGGTERVTLGVTRSIVCEDQGFVPGCNCPENDGSAAGVVLDPFAGSGTTGQVATRLQRYSILIDLDERNQELQEQRMVVQTTMLGKL